MKLTWKIYIEEKGEKSEIIKKLKDLIKKIENQKEDRFPYGFELERNG